jgi:hypothetical protein
MILKIIALYQIVIYSVAAYAFSFGTASDFMNISFVNELFFITLFLFSVSMVLMNLSLFINFKANKKLQFLAIQKWVNFFQIFQLSVLGLSYNFIMGTYLPVYYYYDDHQIFGASFDILKFHATISYVKSNLIFVSLNIIPIIIFYLLNRMIKIIIDEEDDKLVDLISYD